MKIDVSTKVQIIKDIYKNVFYSFFSINRSKKSFYFKQNTATRVTNSILFKQMYHYNNNHQNDNDQEEFKVYMNSKLKKGEKINKQSKDSYKYKDSKQLYKTNTKSQQDIIFTKSQHGDIYKYQPDSKKIKQQSFQLNNNQSNVKTPNIKYQSSRQQRFRESVIIQQQKLAKLYIQNKGDILKIAFILKLSSVENLCMMILPIVKNTLKSLQSMIKKRKLRRVFLPWNDQQLKEFIYKFFEIVNGELYGYSKKLSLDTFWKLIQMRYDTTLSISNQQLVQFYKSILDLHLSVYEDLQNKTTNFQRHMTWSRQELKILCRLLLKTDNLQKVSDVMIVEFGKLKDKFSPKRIFERIDTLIKMSVSKIKHQCGTYPGLGEIRKIMRHDFYNMNYNQAPRYQQIRKELIRYFERDTPPLQQTYDVLCKLNKFLNDERIYQKNQMSDSGRRSIVQERRRINGDDCSDLKFNQSRLGVEVKAESNSIHLVGSFAAEDQVKLEGNSMLANQGLPGSNAANPEQKKIPPQLINLLEMDLQSLSSSDSNTQQPNLSSINNQRIQQQNDN